MLDVLQELLSTIRKMFAADLGLTLTAIAVVGLIALGLSAHVLSMGLAAILLPTGVLAALLLGVWRGARG